MSEWKTEYAIEAIVTQWRMGEIVMNFEKRGKCRLKFYSRSRFSWHIQYDRNPSLALKSHK